MAKQPSTEILAPLEALADASSLQALREVYADVHKAPARFVKKLKALTNSWPSDKAELGRAALDLGAVQLASRHPDKAGRLYALARRLERSASLPVDWDTQVAQAEALGPALDPRDLTRMFKGIGKEAAARYKQDAAAAARLASATVELVHRYLDLGGVPADALAGDVEALLKKARIPAAARTRKGAALLDRLLAAPSLSKAGAKFWAKHHKLVSAHVRGEPRLQDALIRATPQIHPMGYGGTFDRSFAEAWRTLLQDGGCIDALAGQQLETSAADFVELACTRLGVYLSADILMEWLRALAAPLAAGRPLRLFIDDKGAQSFDPDVLDLAIELGLPLEAPDGLAHPWLHLDAWRERRARGEPTRELTHLYDHPQFGALFERMFTHSVEDHFYGDAFAAASLPVAGFRPLWQRRLAGHAAALTDGTLLALEHSIRDLGAIMGPELLRALPALAEIVEQTDVTALLARTLREGLVDEWGWPALDEAHRRIPHAGPHDRDGFTPYLTVYGPTTDTGASNGPVEFVVCGPDGIVHHGPLELPEGVKSPRRVIWIGGQPLVVYHHGSLLLARWGAGAEGETWKTDYLQMGHIGLVLSDGGVTAGGRAIRPGDRSWDPLGGLLTDGTGTWRLRGASPGRRIESFDPQTGETTDAPLHPWLAEVDAEAVQLLMLLPASGDHPTPVGAPGAPWGLRVSQDPDDSTATVAERLDGGTWRGQVPQGQHQTNRLLALMTFPGSSALHTVHRDDDRNCTLVRTADGAHPLGHALFPGTYAAGSQQLLSPEWWGMLRPRDEPGSRALRAASRDVAAALLSAAIDQGAATVPLLKPFAVDADVPRDRPAVFLRFPGLEEAVRQALPQVTHPNLRAGIAGAAVRAAQLEQVIGVWRSSLEELVDAEPVAPEDDITDDEAAVVRTMLPRGAAFFGTFHLGRQLREVERFFFDSAVEEGETRAVSRSAVAWEALLHGAAPIAWRVASPAAIATDQRAGGMRVLSLWARSRFAEQTVRARLRRSFGRCRDYPVPGMTWRASQRLHAASGSRYLVRLVDASRPDARGIALFELASSEDDFRPLDGVTEAWERRQSPWGSSAQLRALLAKLEADGPFPAAEEIGAWIAERTGLLPGSALLLWAGALRNRSLLHEGARTALGLTHADVKLARLELDVDLDALYDAAMPGDPTALWRPLEDDGTGQSPAARLVEAWRAQVGTRPKLDRELLLRVFDDLGDDHRHDIRLRQILQADQVPAFNRDTAWVVRPYTGFRNNISYMQGYVPPGWPLALEQPDGDERVISNTFSGAVLRHMARYLPWLYQELPLGSPLHAAALRWAEALDQRLENPDLLMLAGAVDLSLQEEPDRLAEAFAALRDRFSGAPYVSPDDRPVAPGIDRGDLVVTWPSDLANGLFVAFRPAALIEPEALVRLARELGFDEAFQRHGGICTCGLRFGQWDPLDITELDEFLAWRSAGFQAIRARLRETPQLDPDAARYDADPRVSAPELVPEVAAGLDLSEPGATLYLQTLALARPSRAHVRRYNGWSLDEYRAACVALFERGLVVERKVPATGRDSFLDEDIVEFPTRSSPMESSKLELYGIETDRRGRRIPPFGMVLPLRPLGELFRAAWARRHPGS